MKPLLIQKIPLQTIFDRYPLQEGLLAEYLKQRPGIIENPDIFFENIRSYKLPPEHKNFSFFKEINIITSKTTFICPIYLELYEYVEKKSKIIEIIEYLGNLYSPHRVIVQWNHDIDFASKYLDAEKTNNVFIINFNTSKQIKNDIIAPFWTINTTHIKKEHKYFAGFIGSVNNPLRRLLSKTINNKENYYQTYLPYEKFLLKTSECLFSFCPRGQGLNSYRFYECFHLNTIPILIADNIILPFQSDINYNDICIRIPESKTGDFQYIDNELKKRDPVKMLENIYKIKNKFTLQGVQEEIYRILS